MTDAERERCQEIMSRLYMTGTGETICLTHDDVTILLKHIEELRKTMFMKGEEDK